MPPLLRTRVQKLEAAQSKAVEQLVIVFSVINSDGTPLHAIGYSFPHGEVMLLSNESQERLRERAIAECQQAMPNDPVVVLQPLIRAKLCPV